MSRRFIALIVAAVGTAAPMILAILAFAPPGHAAPPSIAVGLASLGIWLIGGMVVGRWRPTPRLGECLVLGVLLGLLLSGASCSLIILLERTLHTTERSLLDMFGNVEFSGIVKFGVYGLLSGLPGGLLFWQIATPPSASETHRQWQSVKTRNLVGALTLEAGLLWCVAFAALLLQRDGLPAVAMAAILTIGLMVAEFWFLALGLAYLFAIGRRRGKIRRRDCLLLGTLLTCLLPMCIVFLSGVFPGDPDINQSLAMRLAQGTFMAVVLGGAVIPVGLFSGWILWRVGVRPAPSAPSLADPAAVFD